MKMLTKKVALSLLLLFMLPISAFTQSRYISINHRNIVFSLPTYTLDPQGIFYPIIYIEIGQPVFSGNALQDTVNFDINPYWEPKDSVQALHYFDSKPITLTDTLTELSFHFDLSYLAKDLILKPDSTFRLTYLIVDYETKEVIDTALFATGAPYFTGYSAFDSVSQKFYKGYDVKGKRVQPFHSYPGQKVFTKIDLNYSAFTDQYPINWTLTSILVSGFVNDSTEFENNLLPETLSEPSTAIGENRHLPPMYIKLWPNYPNPFNNSTTIPVYLPRSQNVRFEIYDVTGQKVATLFSGKLNPGYHRFHWNGRSDSGKILPTGLYFCRVKGKQFIRTQKLILMR